MQSSTAIAFRALVMLICLITIPLFAIFGKDLPQVIKGLLEGRGLVLGPAGPSGLIGGSGLSSQVGAAGSGSDWKTPPTPGGAQPANFQTPATATPIKPSEVPLRDPLAGGGSGVLTNVDPHASANGTA